MRSYHKALLIVVVLVLGAGIMVVGYSRGLSSDKRITIRWWNPFSGPDGAYALGMVNRFNAEHPGIHVVMQRMEIGTYYNKLFIAGLGNRSPEVFVIHTDVLPRFHRAGLLAPLNDLIKETSFPSDDFDAKTWSAVVFDNETLAIPLDIHPLGMFYNKALFRDAGLVNAQGQPQPPTDYPQFIEALERLKTKDHWGFVFTWLRTNIYAIMAQFGGRMFNHDFSRCTLDSPENIAALQLCVDLIQNRQLVPRSLGTDGWTGFRQGRVGMAFEGVWAVADVGPNTGIDVGAAPLPVLGDHPATWCDSHNLCMSPGLDGPRQEAAWKVLRYLSDNSLDWAQAGQVPARRSLRASDRFQAMHIQNTFAQQIPYAVYPPRVPFIFEFLSEFDIAVEKALRGTVPPEQALREATHRINDVIERDRKMYAQD